MVWNFTNHIQKAYETGDLNDEAQLKLALQYENKLGTRSVYLPICDKLEAHPDCNMINKDADAPGGFFYGNTAGLELIKECRQLLKSSAKPPKLLNHIVPISQIDSIEHVLEPLRRHANDPRKRSRRVYAFNNIWANYAKKRDNHLFWLFKKPLEKDFELHKLLLGLGLFHLKMRKKDEEFLLIQFKIKDRCFKPSWVDADLAFYFDATSHFHNHGYTRDLCTGTRGYKEWVSFARHIELWDVTVLKLNEDTKFHVLSHRFKAIHAKRICGLRK